MFAFTFKAARSTPGNDDQGVGYSTKSLPCCGTHCVHSSYRDWFCLGTLYVSPPLLTFSNASCRTMRTSWAQETERQCAYRIRFWYRLGFRRDRLCRHAGQWGASLRCFHLVTERRIALIALLKYKSVQFTKIHKHTSDELNANTEAAHATV